MLRLEKECSFIVTDSGGVQKEAYFFNKSCITLRDQTEWVELVESGWNTLTSAEKEKIINAFSNIKKPDNYENFYGNGNTGEIILEYLKTYSINRS